MATGVGEWSRGPPSEKAGFPSGKFSYFVREPLMRAGKYVIPHSDQSLHRFLYFAVKKGRFFDKTPNFKCSAIVTRISRFHSMKTQIFEIFVDENPKFSKFLY